MSSLKKNYPFLETLDDSIVATLTFRDIISLAGKREKGHRVLSERLAENFETVERFPTRVEAGEDDCTGRTHPARFLRGYVGNSQELWLQARRVQSRTGLPPIGNYETVSVGLNGFISAKLWHEVHNPSSKALSIRLLTNTAMKSAWNEKEKSGDIHEFASLQELRMAMVALEACVHKVMPWNFSVTTIAIFLQSINFGEIELGKTPDHLSFLADFVDEILRHNAQAWDEGRYYLGHIEVAAKWSALTMRQLAANPAAAKRKAADHGPRDGAGTSGRKFPEKLCKNFQFGKCKHNGDKHSAYWDASIVLDHKCAKWLPDQNRYCLENHGRNNHK